MDKLSSLIDRAYAAGRLRARRDMHAGLGEFSEDRCLSLGGQIAAEHGKILGWDNYDIHAACSAWCAGYADQYLAEDFPEDSGSNVVE